MKIQSLVVSLLAASLPFAVTACGNDSDTGSRTTPAHDHAHDHDHDHAHDHDHDHGHDHAHDSTVWMSWPADGFQVYEDVDFVVGSTEEGRLALLLGADAVPAGTRIESGDRAVFLDAGVDRHVRKLAVGEQKVTLQLCDADGLSRGPAHAATATFTVLPTPSDLGVWFEEPADGARVSSPVKVRFGLGGMALEPAGNAESLPSKTRGHHHLIIDGGPQPVGMVVPADDKNIHYGKAQTETEIELPPGQHTLTMQFADAAHQSYGPRMSKTITIEVIE